jgi:hypothetical protein
MSRRRLVSYIWLSLVLAFAAFHDSRAQDAWEYSPYEVQVYLTAAPGESITPMQWDAIAARLRDRADTVVGGAWRLKVDAPPPELAAALAGGLESLTPESVSTIDLLPDKIIVVAVRQSPAPAIETREFDTRAVSWSAVQSRPVPQSDRLPREAFLALTQSFSPLARVEEVRGKEALLRLRAQGYSPRDPSWQWAAVGDVFRGVLRTNERSGKAKSAQEIPWTVMEVGQVNPSGVLCFIESGVRGAISAKRGRSEVVALLVRPTRGETKLEIKSRTPDAKPLAGYDVYATDRTGTTVERIGRSNRSGAVIVPSGEGKYRVLLIKDGQELLARLPLVPGLAPTATARIPDDAQRLEVEAFVVGLQETVVDLVARRAVLLARAELRLDANDVEAAEKLIEEVRRMETRDQLLQRIAVERRRFVSEDPTVQKKIDRLFDDTTQLLGRYLNPADVESLQRRLREARTASASAK